MKLKIYSILITLVIAIITPIIIYADEIVCSDLRSQGNDSRFGQNNFKKFFSPIIKITDDFIYLSNNRLSDKDFIWHDKIKNDYGSYENAMASRLVSGRTVNVKYIFKNRNNSLVSTINIEGLNVGAAPVIYAKCSNSIPVAKNKKLTNTLKPILSNTKVKSIYVDINHGIDKSSKYVNSTVNFYGMRIDNIPFGNPSVRFKISAKPGKMTMYSLILSSGNTRLNINERNNQGGGRGSDGYKFWLRSDGKTSLYAIVNDFDNRQQKALKSICGYLSEQENIDKHIKSAIVDKSKYMDPLVEKAITSRAYKEFLFLASKCKKVMNSKLSGYETVRMTKSSKPLQASLCGMNVPKSLINTQNLKSIQKDLKVLGFYKSKIDGQFGKGSCKALKEYLSEDNITGKAIKFTKKDRFELRKDARLARFAANKLKEEASSPKVLDETPEVPKEPQTFSLNVGSLSVEYIEDQAKDLKEYKVRLKTMGSEIDTSVVSKSLFGFENVSSVDVILNMSDTNAYVDFVIDEENTKVKFDGSKAFVMRLKDDSSSNVTSGEFGKALGGLDIRDVAMVGAHCSKIQEITKSKDNFVKFIDRNIAISSKDGFSDSPIASDGIVKIINDHATSCVDTLFAVTKVKSAFLIETKIKENVKVQVLNESLTKNTLEKSRLLKSLSAFEMKTQKDAVNVQRTAAKLAKLIDDLDLMRIQLGATSSTDETLEKEVKELEIKISALKDIVPNLELKLQKIQSNIQDANAKLADKTSRETTIDRVLNEASNKAYTLQGEVERFGPQAIAGEETVKNLIIQLKNDYVPLDEFKVEDTRLKELTQVVTESSKEIQLLRKDLFDIRSIEQSYIEKCLADRQCKAVMGERLGVE